MPDFNGLTPRQIHLLRETFVRLADTFLSLQSDQANQSRYDVLERMLGKLACRRFAMDPLPNQFVLSVVVPVFNEVTTISKVIDRLRGCGLPCEIIVVDDGSSDGTREILKGLQQEEELCVLYRERNQGKGAAVKDGFACARGDVVVIQDADMEYDPRDLPSLLQPILEERADVVYGSRYLPQSDNVSPWWHRAGNRLISCLFNFARRKRFSDVETCYKMFRRDVIQRLLPTLRENGFGIEIELSAKLAKLRDVRFCELPICYAKRSYKEGKKIGWRDAVWAIWCIVRY